ncbi:nitroreductase family protein [Paracraurococcus lichenis]|uniref:Nitroreductase family protein n=1 Tax=Paracraurococcus lichenis TaxID=3064888 RepID=A0ABT9DT63_9PROT|nr:nitroreductase family protein [Paracraurococcus sp. LOR1-02]MDO9707084.1 nitroreductase family protein [Paracraurococcus sp. LOR1-02]
MPDTTPDRAAPAAHPIAPLVAQRWSPRSFTGAALPPGALESLLEAARWAASSNNLQPWHYIVARRDQDAAAFERLVGVLSPNNQTWARNAGVLMLSVARLTNPNNGNPMRHALHDTGAASAQMALQAAALGLQAHQMAGFDAAAARAAFGIPEGFEPVAAIAIGEVGPPEALPEVLAQRETAPRQRRAIEEFAFFGGWKA